MTVEELIEELQRQPNKRLPVKLRVRRDQGRDTALRDGIRVRFDGPHVAIEED